MPEPDTETRELACELNQAELIARGDEMADAELRIEALKLERGGVTDQIKNEQILRRKLAGVIDSGKELREVRCVWVEDFPKNVFRLIRQDTGAEVDTRAMSAADRQEDMFEEDEDQEQGANLGRTHPDDDEDDEEERPLRKHLDDEPESVTAQGTKWPGTSS
jgi:hypothetical protein